MMNDTVGGTVAIERLDPAGATDGDLAAVHAVHVACYRVWGGADLLRTSAELAAWVRYPAAFEWRGYWIARDASGDVARFASAGISTHSSTPHLHELLVAPDLAYRVRSSGIRILDAQARSDYTVRMGAVGISRDEYLREIGVERLPLSPENGRSPVRRLLCPESSHTG